MRELIILVAVLAAVMGAVLLYHNSVVSEPGPDRTPGVAVQAPGVTATNTSVEHHELEQWVNPYLESGQIQDGISAFTDELILRPQDDELRFGLGVLHFLRAVERLNQSWYSYGLTADALGGLIPLFRFTTLVNSNPQPITYLDARRVLQDFLLDLNRSIEALSGVTGEVKQPMRIGLAQLDFNGDHQISEGETLWELYAQMNPGAQLDAQTAQQFVIQADTADARWLEAYAHLLANFAEFFLAHDWETLFNHTAHLFFANPQTPFDLPVSQGEDIFYFVDLIAFVHLLNLPVIEPQRMNAALDHLRQVTVLSRQMWEKILAETDDDQEWIPSPTQTGVIPNVQVTQEMVQGWQEFLDEMDDILEGRTLLPFWRNREGETLGLNLKRVFTEPQPFDLVLWVQGTAAQPYLERGKITDPALWQRLDQLFQGQFLGFAIWWN